MRVTRNVSSRSLYPSVHDHTINFLLFFAFHNMDPIRTACRCAEPTVCQILQILLALSLVFFFVRNRWLSSFTGAWPILLCNTIPWRQCSLSATHGIDVFVFPPLQWLLFITVELLEPLLYPHACTISPLQHHRLGFSLRTSPVYTFFVRDSLISPANYALLLPRWTKLCFLVGVLSSWRSQLAYPVLHPLGHTLHVPRTINCLRLPTISVSTTMPCSQLPS